MAPVLPFPPVESYYWHALWYFPVFELGKWLLMAAIMHLALRLLRMPSDYDVLLNLSGISVLIIDPAIRIWDWIVYAAGWSDNTVLMGVAHALIFWPWVLRSRLLGCASCWGCRHGWSCRCNCWYWPFHPVGGHVLAAMMAFIRPDGNSRRSEPMNNRIKLQKLIQLAGGVR